jgi:hypothetical protein
MLHRVIEQAVDDRVEDRALDPEPEPPGLFGSSQTSNTSSAAPGWCVTW